jgi:hypothetical protein
VLVVPLQLSKAWIFFGWLVEAALFVWFGRNNRIRPLEYMGNGLIILSHGAFFLWNGWILTGMHLNFGIYDAKYAALIGLEVFVAWVYWNAGRKYPDVPVPGIARQIREPIAAHLCLYLIYEVSKLYNHAMQVFGGTEVERIVLVWTVVVVFNEAGKRLNASQFIQFREYRWVTEFLAYLLLMVINGIGLSDASGPRWVLDILLILLANTAIFWRMNCALMDLQLYKRVTGETRSIVLAAYALSVYFINVMFRYTGNSESLILNLSLIAFALLYISLGFRNRLVTLRRAGLALALAGTAKMLIVDSLSFSLGQKIISYLIFGFVLIVISVVYQKLTARMLQDETGV